MLCRKTVLSCFSSCIYSSTSFYLFREKKSSFKLQNEMYMSSTNLSSSRMACHAEAECVTACVICFLSPCRALFDYDGSASDLSAPNQALPFHFGDILHVSSASEEEWWPARHLSPPPPNCPEVGVIPSRRRSEFKGFQMGVGGWFY